MKILKRILPLTITLIIIIITLTYHNLRTISTNSRSIVETPVKVGVLLYNFDDLYVSTIKQALEDIQKDNKNKIEFTFFDGKANVAIQSEIINNLLQSNYDLLLINLVEKREQLIETIIYGARQRNLPVILFNTTPTKTDLIRGYNKSLIINSDIEQSAILQGKLLVDEWNANKETVDKNGDNIMQYVMLQGKAGSLPTIVRSKNSIETINNAGIMTKEIISIPSNWSKELAMNAITSIFPRYGNDIEVIIANNDAMAIGAIEALQKYGYNLGDKSKTIPVVGIDALPEAKELIKKGYMTGSVLQDSDAMAEALYTVGMNLVSGINPIEGTNYEFDNTGVTILLPYREYTKKYIHRFCSSVLI